MRDHEQAFKNKGASLAAIGLGDANYARSFREETGIKFPLLIDDQRAAYRAAGLKKANLLHLLRADNAKARKRAQAAGHRQVRLSSSAPATSTATPTSARPSAITLNPPICSLPFLPT